MQIINVQKKSNKSKNLVTNIVAIFMIIILSLLIVNLYFPREYSDIIELKAKKYDVDPIIIYSVIHAESKFKIKAESTKKAKGLMQIIEKTAVWASDEIGINDFIFEDINDPDVNIEIGSWYLKKLYDQYGNWQVALAAYNAGSGNVSKWLNDTNYSKDGKTLDKIPFKETENYIKRVELNYKVYEVLVKLPNWK